MTELYSATDYPDEVMSHGFYDRENIASLMAYLSELGVPHAEWITYRNGHFDVASNHPFDLLSTAVDAAHAEGLELHAVFKPFEGSLCHAAMPHSFPRPEGVRVLEHPTGLYPFVDPFVAEHPELRIRRKPHTGDPGGPIETVRLVKADDAPTEVEPADLSVLTSDTITDFEPYEGPVERTETVETYASAADGVRECRVLCLEGLEIPEEERFLVVRCDVTGEHGEFTNELGRIVECRNEDGEAVPLTPGNGPVETWPFAAPESAKQMSPYLRHPDVREAIEEADHGEHYEFETYRVDAKPTDEHTVEEAGEVAVMRGKPEHLLGNLHPAYEAVRERWLSLVEECIEAGVDGVNFRLMNHTRAHDNWEYGYNEPVLEESGGRIDQRAVARANGAAYTEFLREATELLRANDREVGVHLSYHLFTYPGNPNYPIPRNFEWEWETWIEEFADYVELRGAGPGEWNRERVVDRVAEATEAAPRPVRVAYQTSTVKERRSDDPLHASWFGPSAPEQAVREALLEDIEAAKAHPGVDAYLLYETDAFTRLTDDGTFEGSEALADILADQF